MSLGQNLASILLQGLVVFATSKVVPGFRVKTYGSAIGVVLVYGLLSWAFKWALVVVALPALWVTFGLFMLVINAFLLWLTDKLLDSVEFKTKSALLLSTLLITIGQSIVARVVGG